MKELDKETTSPHLLGVGQATVSDCERCKNITSLSHYSLRTKTCIPDGVLYGAVSRIKNTYCDGCEGKVQNETFHVSIGIDTTKIVFREYLQNYWKYLFKNITNNN